MIQENTVEDKGCNSLVSCHNLTNEIRQKVGGGGGENTFMSKVFRHKVAFYTSKVVKSL
jgi:hypothetical protein